MEFTEITELNEMINFTKSFKPADSVLSYKSNYFSGGFLDFGINTNKDLNLISIDEVLENSPVNHEVPNIEKIVPNIQNEINETEEDIIKDIQESLANLRIEKDISNDEDENMDNKIKSPIKIKNNKEKNGEKNIEENLDNGFNKQKFDKVKEEHISNSFNEKRILKSSLSIHLIKSQTMKPITKIQINSSKVKQKEIKVFFFLKPIYLKMSIFMNFTVNDVIKTIITNYMNDLTVDKTLMKYPSEHEAYELRFLEEDDDYKPEMSFDPLEKERKFIDYNIDSLAFCEIPNFKPSPEKKNQIVDKKFEEIAKKKDNMVINISFANENMNSKIEMNPEKIVKDIIPLIQLKTKLNLQNFIIKTNPTKEQMFNEFIEPEIVDINMPLKYLRTPHILLQKRKWADDPNPNVFYEKNPYVTDHDSDFEPILNEVQACQYHEFDVVKINERNQRQNRLLGIDQFKIYNKIREKDLGIANFINKYTSGSHTKNAERFIENVKDAVIISNNKFIIEVINEAYSTKVLTFETESAKNAKFIVAKLKYLINMPKAKRMQKHSN